MPSKRPPRDERGVALAVAVAVVFVVILVSTTAIRGSVASITQTGIATRQVNTVDAAEGGLQYEINNIETASSQSATCPPTVSLSSGTARLSYSTSGTAGPFTACDGSAIPLTAGSTLVLKSAGASTLNGYGGAQTDQAELTFTAVAQQPVFDRALYALTTLTQSGSMDLHSPSGAAGTAHTYTTGDGYCGTSTLYDGNVFINATSGTTTTAGGACVIDGNLYVNGNWDDTGSGTIGTSSCTASGTCGNVYVTGNVSLTGGSTIYGNVYAAGTVDVGSSRVYGSVHGEGNVTVENSGETVSQGVYSAGNIRYLGGSTPAVYAGGTTSITSSLAGSAYSVGSVSVTGGGSGASGAIESSNGSVAFTANAGQSVGSAYVSSGQTISNCPNSSVCHVGAPFNPAFPGASTFQTTVTLPTAPAFPSYTYNATDWTGASPAWVIDNITAPSGCGSSQESTFISDVQAMSSATSPTVIRTPCQVIIGAQGDQLGGNMVLNSDLAIIADGGIVFQNAGVTVQSTGTLPNGQSDRHLFLIVPSTSTYQNVSCSTASSPGNIDMENGNNLSANNTVSDFLYTPDSVCTSGTLTMQGKIYAGTQVVTTATWNDTYDPNINPVSTPRGGGSNNGLNATLQWIRRSAS